MDKKTLGKYFFIVLFFLVWSNSNLLAQDSLAIIRFDERHLNLWPGTTVIVDATAHGGHALFRSASSSNDTFWYGPYRHFQAGNYLVQFRLKVASNTSRADLLNLNVVSTSGGVGYGIIIKPNMFRKNNEWQLFTVPVQIPENTDYLELRGTNFISGITDVYMDYITVLSGDARGIFSDEFSIDGKGNVGVGTLDTKGYKLAVAGNMITESVKVQLQGSWPDYVFARDYRLPSLAETEKYITEKGHLEGIPSASEVKSNGIDLGEMNARLLKKIEELTLHLIEQQKQINNLNERVGDKTTISKKDLVRR